MRVCRAWILLLFAAAPLAAQTPAFEFRGEHFDDPPPKQKLFGGPICKDQKGIEGGTWCGGTSGGTIGETKLGIIIRSYLDNKLYAMSIYFGTDSYNRLTDILTLKYGKPDSVYTTPVQTALNAQYLNETSRWTFSDGQMEIRKYADTIDKGEISAVSVSGLAEADKRSKASAQAAALRDLGPPTKH